jgi:hypothetical protein
MYMLSYVNQNLDETFRIPECEMASCAGCYSRPL